MQLELGEPDAKGFLAVRYDLDDPEGALVTGELEVVGQAILTRELVSGRGTVIWDVAASPPGRHVLGARVDDDGEQVMLEALAEYEVADTGEQAPVVTVAIPTSASDPTHQPLLTDRDSPVTLAIETSDADGDPLEVAIHAVRGTQEVEIGDSDPVAAGVQWAFDDRVTPGDGWRVRVRAEDGRYLREARSLPFSIGRASNGRRFDDAGDVISDYCYGCHNGKDSEGGLDFDFIRYDDDVEDGGIGVYTARGRIYRRAVLQRNMPPVSAELRFAQPPMPDEARAILGEWLLGGAPE
jgi:hypothetical protein